MDKISAYNPTRLPSPPRSSREAMDNTLHLAQMADHFLGGIEPKEDFRSQKVRHQFKVDDTLVKFFRTEHFGPSTGLRHAASATAGIAGSLLSWVAPQWGESLKELGNQLATQPEKTSYTRTLITGRNWSMEEATIRRSGQVEYELCDDQGSHLYNGHLHK